MKGFTLGSARCQQARAHAPRAAMSRPGAPCVSGRRRARCHAASPAADAPAVDAVPITLSDKAVKHLERMKEDKGNAELLLRVGVRSGGCSGLSYAMEFEAPDKVGKDDSVMDVSGVKLVCDPASMLYLFGMRLDYSDALVGGGFQFQNPNAEDTCGCGKSFGV